MSRTREHGYEVTVRWAGNTGEGTTGYRSYSRDTEITSAGKPTMIVASADKTFVGDPERWNPEEMLVAALSQCHMLSFLALCSLKGVVVTSYEDAARGTMVESAGTPGHFTEVVLTPVVTLAEESMRATATELHAEAHRQCFIANSVNFPVTHEPVIRVAG
ncbi:OsmC family protein [Streptomyces hainanensis]|uniref:OsmC family peroxiredoxin n=1 Tax=Streptomyces hainanensis TaxID=402648 RepID=A0A4R4TDY8_9ACTN|nr:OsmC family protein [Streptomyces hainanensis]TDC74386.1 OsmC family peroxiredoxin [Streptomyces hainanensis]